ncbi:hypothetical protein AVL61_12090 [Kocuria rosea subsp. polaris]|uniref:Uncharacterized protein n=1 Tax=Kocuria rosea subsp. polaris TaxID=136273 RepID=A0A0W8I4L1_KOCRO|nr:hypothetical protein [Kocuria polaris]KUG52958.1 hypothetical protein AVL61_12090 [Kocuria polaris]
MTRRRIFKEDAWSSLAPHQKGLLIGLGMGAALWAFTGTLSWIAAGVGLGSGLGLLLGRRRAHNHRPARTSVLRLSTTPRPRRTPSPRVLTEEQRESSLYAAAWFNGTRMAEGKTDRAGALKHMRETIGGFPPERYETQLDAALSGIEEAKARVAARRAKDIAEARQLDALNAVFELHYFNCRFSGHIGEYGLGPINLSEALGDLFDCEQIDEAVTRSDALIEEGWSCAYYPDDNGRQVQQLREHHPGYTDAHLHQAADWGYFMNR